MTEIIFYYKGIKTSIQGKKDVSMKNIFEAFKNKMKINDDIKLIFEFNHEIINEEILLEKFISVNQIITNKIEIFVKEKNEFETKNLSEEVICPECMQETSIINITEDKILLKCNQDHTIEIKKTEFKKSQMIIKQRIQCECKYNSDNTKRFCLTCNKDLCTFCEKNHINKNNKHIIIDYTQKNYFCLEHNLSKNQFIGYCETCKKDLCWICYDFHRNHQIGELKEIYYFKDKLNAKHKAFSSIMKKLEKQFEELKKQMDNFRSTNEMNENIIKNYNIENRNYTKLNNYKIIYEKNFNLQKINKMVKYLNNITKNNNNFQEINVNNNLSKSKNEEMIKKHNQEIKECNSFIPFNKSHVLNEVKILLNEKIENNKEIKNNLNLNENNKKSVKSEKQNEEIANKISKFKYIISVNEKNNKIEDEKVNENEKQEDEEISEIKVNNITKIIEPFFNKIDENYNSEENKNISKIKENQKNMSEENIKSCNKNEKKEKGKEKEKEKEKEYNGNENNQRIIEKKTETKLMKKDSNNNLKKENQIKLIYNTKNIKGEKIIIFGKNFVKRNKDKCKFIYKGQKYGLTEYFNIPKDNKEILEIFLEGIDKITDASEMFSYCTLLYNVDDIYDWDTSNITNMSKMFENCESLTFLNLSKWNLVNVTNIKYMFSHCKSLKELGDLSGWNTNNITNMSNLFEGCESLSHLPDLSKWNMKNVTNIDYMFSGCKSLVRLPDLSIWNINSVTSMNHLFMNCENLATLPDLSKWDIQKVTSIENMFCGCKSLKILPDISKWKVNNVTDMSHLFEKCQSLLTLPDMSNWNIINVTNIQRMFYGCLNLKEIILFTAKKKLENINELFFGCDSLKEEPDIKKWNLNEIEYKDNLYGNCFKLKRK